jgi:equilibrative nucleoside transporter 1/2/3
MDRVQRLFMDRGAYEPLDDSAEVDASEDGHDQERAPPRFSRLEYSVFFLLGVSMLWVW